MNQQKFMPNRAAILAHLRFLFENTGDEHSGWIEISNTPPNDRALNTSKYFLITELEEAADYAVERNSIEGVNVYVGAALRHTDTPLFKRSNIEFFGHSNFVWVDLDDDGAAQSAKDKYKDMPPSCVVVTGRHPELRAQLWWRLDAATTDPTAIKPALAGACSFLRGDKAVVDPIRVMRLGGTVAWPKKDGRIPELTEFIIPQQNTTSVSLDVFKGYFRGIESASPLLTTKVSIFPEVGFNRNYLNLSSQREFSQDEIRSMLYCIRPDCSYADWLAIGMALKDYGIPFNIFDGWSAGGGDKYKGSNDCLYHWNSFNKTGTTIGTLVHFAKQQGWVPRNDAATLLNKPSILDKVPPRIEETVSEPPKGDTLKGETVAPIETSIKATSIDDIDLDKIPPREFLYADILARKYVSMVIAPPGAGKSILSMQLGLSAASGKPWGEWSSKIKGLNVWVYNNEEGSDELTRRIKGIMMHNHINKSDLSGKFYIDSGEHQSINVAKFVGENVVFTEDYVSMLQEIVNRKIDILIVDPFAEMHSITENSNDGMKVVTALFRKIAFDANCAVLLIHHAKKWSEGMAGNADSGRGGGAQIGVVRRAFTLAKMSEDEAKKMGVPNDKRHWYVRFDDAKSNITAPAEKTLWLKFKSVNIMNGSGLYPDGDSVGVLDHISVDDIKKETGDVLSANEEKILSYIAMFSDGAGGNNFPFNDARDYIADRDYSLGSPRTISNLMDSAVENVGYVNHMGTRYDIEIIKNTSQKNKKYIFISKE